MSKSVTGSLLRSKNQELVVSHFLRMHGKTTYIPQDIIDLIVLFFVRFDFIFSPKLYKYLRRESTTCWINNYCVLKCWVEKTVKTVSTMGRTWVNGAMQYVDGVWQWVDGHVARPVDSFCIFSIETAKLSQFIKHISMQLNLYCSEVSQFWTKPFGVAGTQKLCVTLNLFKPLIMNQIKTLHVIWNTKLLSIEYKPNSMIYHKPLTNIYTLNIDSKEKLEWLITATNAKHILLNNCKVLNNPIIQQIYWYRKTFYFQMSSYQQNAAITFVINLFGEEKTFQLNIHNKSKTKIGIKFDRFESVYYKLKFSGKSKPDITTKNDGKIIITLNSKPFGFSLHEDVDGLNAICGRVKKKELRRKQLKKGLYIHSINDIIVDNKPFDDIKSLLRKSLPPTTIIFSRRPQSNISISSRYTALLLVGGYIHEIEDNLFDSGIIIPQIINQICFQFYFTSTLIYCLISRSESMGHHPLHIADINDEMKKTLKSFECNIFCLNEPECIETAIDNPSPRSFGLCRANNLKLPQNVNNQLLSNYSTLTSFHSVDYYNDSPNVVLFKIGGHDQFHGATDECYAIILTDSQFTIKKEEEQTNSVKEIDTFSWRLPSLPVPMQDICACFSDRRQSLICIGGGSGKRMASNKIYSLSFSEIRNRNWLNEENMIEWQHLTDMTEKRREASGCFIQNGDNKLFVVGGRNQKNNGLNSGEIFDFTTTEWMQIANVPYKTFGAGVCYERRSNKVYLGGGYTSWDNPYFVSRIVVLYDINKNMWYNNLKPYTSNHLNCPVLWINNNILSIMSANSRTIEYLDLRVTARWKKMSKNDLLTDTLGVECDSNQCRLYI